MDPHTLADIAYRVAIAAVIWYVAKDIRADLLSSVRHVRNWLGRGERRESEAGSLPWPIEANNLPWPIEAHLLLQDLRCGFVDANDESRWRERVRQFLTRVEATDEANG